MKIDGGCNKWSVDSCFWFFGKESKTFDPFKVALISILCWLEHKGLKMHTLVHGNCYKMTLFYIFCLKWEFFPWQNTIKIIFFTVQPYLKWWKFLFNYRLVFSCFALLFFASFYQLKNFNESRMFLSTALVKHFVCYLTSSVKSKVLFPFFFQFLQSINSFYL